MNDPAPLTRRDALKIGHRVTKSVFGAEHGLVAATVASLILAGAVPPNEGGAALLQEVLRDVHIDLKSFHGRKDYDHAECIPLFLVGAGARARPPETVEPVPEPSDEALYEAGFQQGRERPDASIAGATGPYRQGWEDARRQDEERQRRAQEDSRVDAARLEEERLEAEAARMKEEAGEQADAPPPGEAPPTPPPSPAVAPPTPRAGETPKRRAKG